MVTIIKYDEIRNLTAVQAVDHIHSMPRHALKDLTVADLLKNDWLAKSITEPWYNDIFKKGIYIFYDTAGNCRYVGQTKDSFYGRFMAQLDTTPAIYYNWNAVLRKLGGIRLSKPHHELNEEDHKVDYKTLEGYNIILIEVEYYEEMQKEIKFSPNNFKYLERLIMKGYKEIGCPELLNTNVGWLVGNEKKNTLTQLIGK